MSDKLLVAMLKAESSGPEEDPIIRTFQGAERDKMVNANFENLLEVMCKGGDFNESQQQIAQYVKKGIADSKANNYAIDMSHIEITVYDGNDQPKPRIDANGNAVMGALTLQDIAGKYIDERERKVGSNESGTKFDCLDMRAVNVSGVGRY